MTSFTRRSTPTQATQVFEDGTGRVRFERGIQETICTRPVSSVVVAYMVQLPSGEITSGTFETGPGRTFSEFLATEYQLSLHSDDVWYSVIE